MDGKEAWSLTYRIQSQSTTRSGSDLAHTLTHAHTHSERPRLHALSLTYPPTHTPTQEDPLGDESQRTVSGGSRVRKE